MTGTWTPDGRYVPLPPGQFTLTCTVGAHAKCLQQGYWPWATTPQGDSLEPYLQACTRLMRADYAGTEPFRHGFETLRTLGHEQRAIK